MIDYVKGVPRNEFLESSRVAVGLLRSLQFFGNNSILETPIDVLFVALESYLDKISHHVHHATRNIVEWYRFARQLEHQEDC